MSRFIYLIGGLVSHGRIPSSDAVDHPELSVSTSEKSVLLITSIVYAAVAVAAFIGWIGCLDARRGLLLVYERASWGFLVAQVGVTVWFIYSIFYDQKCLLWRCNNVVRITLGAADGSRR